MILLTGDTHGNHRKLLYFVNSANTISEQCIDNEILYFIILGDFGYTWNNDIIQSYINEVDVLNDKIKILFIDGNHENFNVLYNLPEVKMFDSVVGQLCKNTFHLKRGNIYNIEGKTIFTMGGAVSIDKQFRTPNVTWWEQEQPSHSEFENALNNLEKHNYDVDIILTHTCSNRVLNKYVDMLCKGIDASHNTFKVDDNCMVKKFLDMVEEKTTFKNWYFGHFHTDMWLEEGITCVYNKIIKLEN